MRAWAVSLAALPAAFAAVADLTKVDADGVTEVGGSAEYSRMLPRTGAAGRLDASLLPPVADWASTPIPGLYYVAGGVEKEGNGSPQYPFKTIEKAVEASSGRRALDALMFAPGTYSGTVTLSGAKAEQFALVGIGGTGGATFAKLVLASDGATKYSCVVICNADVVQLVVNVPDTTVYLHNTTVRSLSGSSTALKVRRYDMGARVLSASIAYSDSYYGHPTAPEARALVAGDSTKPMKLADGRATVGDRTVAYLDDVASATTTVYSAISGVSGGYASLGARITAEEKAREEGDSALQATISDAKKELAASIGKVGDGWNSQLESLSSRMTAANEAVAELRRQETNDVAELRASVETVKTAYAAADEAMATTLRNEFKTGMSDTTDSVDGIVDDRFDKLIDAKAKEIVDEAVKTVNESQEAGGLASRLSAAEGDISSLKSTQSSQATSISNLQKQNTAATKSVVALENKHDNDINSLSTRIDTLGTTVGANNTAVVGRMDKFEQAEVAQNSSIGELQTQVKDILTRLEKLEDASSSK